MVFSMYSMVTGLLLMLEHAAGFAGCGANSSREFREVVGAAEDLDGIFPLALIHGSR